MFSFTLCSGFRPGAGRSLPSHPVLVSLLSPEGWKGLLTSVVESRGRAHAPLSLVHAGRAGAAHLHADIGHLLRLQGPHHHHVHVPKLVSTHVLQADPRGPRLRPCDQTAQGVTDRAPGKAWFV